MKIVKPLEECGLQIKGVSETIKNVKEQKGRFLSMLLGTLGASFSGNLLAGKGTVRAGLDFLCCLILQQIFKCKGITK